MQADPARSGGAFGGEPGLRQGGALGFEMRGRRPVPAQAQEQAGYRQGSQGSGHLEAPVTQPGFETGSPRGRLEDASHSQHRQGGRDHRDDQDHRRQAQISETR